MQDVSTSGAGEGASLSRRSFLTIAAASTAATSPAVALAEASGKAVRLPQPPELPIDRIERLGQELSAALRDHANGEFYATTYPQEEDVYPMMLRRIGAEMRKPSLDVKFQECIERLKAILAEMHPEAPDVRHHYAPMNNGRSYVFAVAGHAPALAEWDGPGNYELSDGNGLPSGLYFVDRQWSDMDRRWYFYAAFLADGQPVAPREIIEPRQIVRKIQGVVV